MSIFCMFLLIKGDTYAVVTIVKGPLLMLLLLVASTMLGLIKKLDTWDFLMTGTYLPMFMFCLEDDALMI